MTVYTPAATDRIVSSEALARGLLALLIFSGSFVMFEPSPYEALFIPTLLAFLLAGVTVPSAILPMMLLMTLFGIGAAMAWTEVASKPRTLTHMIVSVFMVANAIAFAMILSTKTLERFAVIRKAYIASAVVASILGVLGYFNVGGQAELLTLYGRAKGLFKDPNVFAPFLILPMMLLLQDILIGKVRRLIVILPIFAILLLGLLLAFSRGAWVNFIVCSIFSVVFLLVLFPSPQLRARILFFSLAGLVAGALALVALLAVPEIREAFEVRAKFVQKYDVGSGGRFTNQIRNLSVILEKPIGLGPHGFSRTYGADVHNVYLNGFFTYGWLGGLSFIGTIVLTWIVGLRALFLRSPYSLPFAAVMATFMGVSLQGIIVDIDHWRHLFLLIGMVWGFIAAIDRWQKERSHAALTRGV